MNVVNETPFKFAPFVGKVVYPKDTITLIVKGTFQLLNDTPAEVVPPDEQMPPTGDIFYDDDPHTSVRYESDFTCFKPKADVMIVGHCHVPDGQFAEACSVAFQAGPISKSLMVFGDRIWQRTLMGTRSQSDPEPFAAMALRYENSFGGPGYKRNPIGKGIRSKESEHGQADNELPNLKVLEGDQLATMHEGIPAGFGPLGRAWSQRMALVGSYGAKWKKERWPWLPEDFDWGYFNAAPADQQIKGYLKGNEALFFKNMHPEHSEWHTSLPGTRVRCFLSEQLNGQYRFREVQTQLDTLWIDMDETKLVLVWRGLATVASPGCEQIENVLIIQESLADEPLALDYYEQLLNDRKAEAAVAAAPIQEEEQDDIQADADDAMAAIGAEEDPAMRVEIQKVMAQAREAVGRSGLDPKVSAALKSEKDPERFVEQLIQGLNIDPKHAGQFTAHARRLDKKALLQQRSEVEKLLTQHGYDASIIEQSEVLFGEKKNEEPLPPPSREELAAAAKKADRLPDQDMSGIDFSGMSLEAGNFKGAQLEGANFSKALLAGSDFSEANLESANFEGADLSGAIFKEADLSNGQLNGARLSGADLSDAILTQATLQAAELKGAILSRVQLGQANLAGSVLSGANLEQADFTGTCLAQADLTEAQLSYSILDGADLTQANCSRVTGTYSSLNNSILVETDFSHAVLEDSNFSNCRCDFANFESARLTRATFEGAVGRQVNFHRARLDALRAGERVSLPESVFRRAKGARANWSGANLQGSDYILAQMPACDFSQANMTGCDCRTAEMKQAVFDKACLSKVRFNRANLFQSRMEAADLTGTNFKGCNLYGSEFLNAIIDKKTKFGEANLKGTKLAAMNI